MPQEPMCSTEPDAREALRLVDPATLLAALVSATGDSNRTADFAPHLTHTLGFMGMDSSLPVAQHEALVEWGVEVVADNRGREQSPPKLSDDAFVELARLLLGFSIPVGSADFLREQAGIRSFVHAIEPSTTDDFSVAIVGAGMAGVIAAVAARRAGFRVTVLEKQDAVGGVWQRNRYPGVGVDTLSVYYSLSFAMNSDWTHTHPGGGEYRDYLERVARENGILDDTVFGAEVLSLTWEESGRNWLVRYRQDGADLELRANAVVTAAGYLTRPQLPNVEGLESFAGSWLHSADWDQSLDFTGKRVGIVGTGCTSVQIVDSLLDRASEMTIFQRQPHWIFPPSGGLLPEHERWCLQNVPQFTQWNRLRTFLMIGDANYAAVRFDEEWASTHDLSISPANDQALQVALTYLETTFSDRPDLLAKLTPDFAPFGKRPVRDPGRYFEALGQDTTTLVTSGLSRVVPDGVIDGDGMLRELDVIIYATGFSLEYLGDTAIEGRGGRRLSDVWADRPSAYNGCLVPGFPNLFITSGPNANPSHGGGHNFCVENVVHYAIACLQRVLAEGASSIEATSAALERWQEEVDERLADSIWVREQRATTYYRNATGEVLLASPFRMEEYWNRLRCPDLVDLTLSGTDVSERSGSPSVEVLRRALRGEPAS